MSGLNNELRNLNPEWIGRIFGVVHQRICGNRRFRGEAAILI